MQQLKTQIEKAVSDEGSLQVEIEIEGFKKPITVTNLDGEDELKVQFGQNGDIKYQWVAKLSKKVVEETVKTLAHKVAQTTMSTLVDIVINTFKSKSGWAGIKQLKWY